MTTQEQPEPKSEPPKQVELVLESESAALLVFGLFLLGTVLGGVAGASVADGISATLLSSLLTFVAGAVLTFSGFRVRRRAGDPIRVSPARLGAAVTALSIGVWTGLGAGVYAKILWMKWRDEVEADDGPANVRAKTQAQDAGARAAPATTGSNANPSLASPAQAVPQPIIVQLPCAEPKATGKKHASGPLQVDPG